MTKEQFLESAFDIAKKHGHEVEINLSGLRQIDVGHKKLHEGHLAGLYPDILEFDAHIPTLIEQVAPDVHAHIGQCAKLSRQSR